MFTLLKNQPGLDDAAVAKFMQEHEDGFRLMASGLESLGGTLDKIRSGPNGKSVLDALEREYAKMSTSGSLDSQSSQDYLRVLGEFALLGLVTCRMNQSFDAAIGENADSGSNPSAFELN